MIVPDHGEVGKENPNVSNPVNLTIRLPELKWMVIFGEAYIQLFGRDKLLSTPCYKVHEYGEILIGIQLVESIFDEIPSSLKKSIKQHLGEEAFVEENKGINRYRTGLTPEFDFSGVLFEPTKPIEEPQVKMRKR